MVSASELLLARGLAEGLVVVGASAGSGKTHHLTGVVTGALRGGAEAAIDVESLVAVTYTTRAASELRSRIRQELVRSGATESALRLPLARLGTVHSVCLSWLEDFAVDAGMPPGVRVLPDDGGLQFRRLLEQAIPSTLQARLSTLGKRLQVRWDNARNRSDWLWHVFEMIDLARSNRITPEMLRAMAPRSLTWIEQLLPPPTSRDLDTALTAALERAETDLAGSTDLTKVTREALTQVKTIRGTLRQGRASWNDWATLATLKTGKKSQDLVANLQAIAAEFEAHPRFQSDLRELTEGVFECAQLGLQGYQKWKTRLRLVDYVDMLERALGLLDRPEIARELGDRLKLLVVDEFQDTSPIQLELFLRLHRLTGRSTWVGDRKQCIFEFAGADPQLMDSVTRWVAENGGASEQLPFNYRSRPELVSLCSELFSRALAPHGYTREEVAVLPRREVPAELDRLAPLGIFSLSSTSVEKDATAIARGIQRLLRSPPDTPIVDRHTGQVRPLQAGDIAVLVRTNAAMESIARELGVLHIRAALARPGLLRTPEGTLLDAAISFLVDRHDGVAAATLDALHGFSHGDPDRWLAEQIQRRHARRDANDARERLRAEGNPEASPSLDSSEADPANDVTPVATHSPWRAPLQALDTEARQLSPRQTVDAVLTALDLERLVLGWPDPDQRSGNLDALRALADHYEETCRVTGAAASLAGLLHYFDQAREALWDGTELRATDEQHFSQGPGAVVLCTYHRAKGLEWPVVILASLDAAPRGDAFGVSIQAPGGPLDPARPLDGRWIRYFPRPLSGRKNFELSEREALSTEGLEARDDELRERARLLYVGFTRARDHLILAARNKKGGLAHCWLDELLGQDGAPLLRLPMPVDSAEAQSMAVAGSEVRVAVRAWEVGVEEAVVTGVATAVMNDTAAVGNDTVPVALNDAVAVALNDAVAVALNDAVPVAMNDTLPVLTWRRPASVPVRESFWITPSSAEESRTALLQLRFAELVRVGAPLSVRRAGNVDWAAFGNTVHGFLTADLGEDEMSARLRRAQRLLAACTSGASVDAESLIAMSNALRTFVDERWPGAVWHREVPIRVGVGSGDAARRVNGEIDLLLETEAGYVVIDHKTYGNPGEVAVRVQAEQYLPQLAAYGRALEGLGGKGVLGYWLHFGVAGVCLRLG
jgi:ATP-dependent helicase/nuclease subunit A